MLGPLQITAAGREIGTGLRKARELLAFLTVHGAGGATGEAISEALWPGAPSGHGTRQRNIALRKARELLRTATGLATPMWITLTAGRYRLDPALTGADLWQFQAALEAARTAGDDQARLAALHQAVACYRGPLADGAGYDWAEPYAETARRRALDAWARIAEILQPADPEQALSALEAALTHDPYNEYTYQQIMRLQAAAGPRRRRPAYPRPAGSQAQRAGHHAGRQHPPARLRPAGHRRTARPQRRPVPARTPARSPPPGRMNGAAAGPRRGTRPSRPPPRARLDPAPAATLPSPQPDRARPRTGPGTSARERPAAGRTAQPAAIAPATSPAPARGPGRGKPAPAAIPHRQLFRVPYRAAYRHGRHRHGHRPRTPGSAHAPGNRGREKPGPV